MVTVSRKLSQYKNLHPRQYRGQGLRLHRHLAAAMIRGHRSSLRSISIALSLAVTQGQIFCKPKRLSWLQTARTRSLPGRCRANPRQTLELGTMLSKLVSFSIFLTILSCQTLGIPGEQAEECFAICFGDVTDISRSGPVIVCRCQDGTVAEWDMDRRRADNWDSDLEEDRR